MKIRLLASMYLLFLLLVACDDKSSSEGRKEGTLVHKDFLNYMNNEIPTLENDEMEIVKLYSKAVSKEYVEDDVLQETIEREVIPAYANFITKIEAIKPKTDEVKELHKVFHDAHKTQFTALEKVLMALEKQDESLFSDANKMLEEGKIKLEFFGPQIDELAEKIGVEPIEE